MSATPRSAVEIQPILMGATLPGITLMDSGGGSLDLNAAVAEMPTVLLFYRGGWCPYCDMHFSKLHQIEGELSGLGYQMIAVSPDKPAHASITGEKHQFDCILASDGQMEAASALGIAYQLSAETVEQYKGYGIDLEEASGRDHHLLPVPSVFIIGTDGVIRYSYVNPDYKVRLDPQVLLAAARAALSHET